jgi:hypothetical protein
VFFSSPGKIAVEKLRIYGKIGDQVNQIPELNLNMPDAFYFVPILLNFFNS